MQDHDSAPVRPASSLLEPDDAAEDPDFGRWLRLLVVPGSSLGGARPKASVVDETGQPWVAKFPSRRDGWRLAPAYDLNANSDGEGLTLNICEVDNAQNVDLAREVARYFRLTDPQAREIVTEMADAVASWPDVAEQHGIPGPGRDRYRRAFRVALTT